MKKLGFVVGLVLVVFACSGDSETAPEVAATGFGTDVELCVSSVGPAILRVQASSAELEPTLIFRDNEDGLSFQAPWTGTRNDAADSSRCYSLSNLDPIPMELTVGVFTDGEVGSFSYAVPVVDPS